MWVRLIHNQYLTDDFLNNVAKANLVDSASEANMVLAKEKKCNDSMKTSILSIVFNYSSFPYSFDLRDENTESFKSSVCTACRMCNMNAHRFKVLWVQRWFSAGCNQWLIAALL